MADAVAQVIQCPQCSKKFKLPAKPPAVFTCTGCGTAMDLSAFRTAAAAAPAPAPAAAAPPADSEARSSSARASRPAGRSRGSGAPARLTARVRRGRAAAGDEDDEVDARAARAMEQKKKTNMLIVVSLIGFVVIIGIVFIVAKSSSRKDEEAAAAALESKKKAAEEAAAMAEATAVAPMDEPVAMAEPEKPAVKKGSFHTIGHHPDATSEEQTKIDALIQTGIFENAGSDSLAARKELVGFGMKAAPRLINVFYTVSESQDHGFDDRIGRANAGVADATLRKIDGYLDRKHNSPIVAASQPDYAKSTARQWIAWWDNEIWKKNPQKPYDPLHEGGDESAAPKPDAAMDAAPMDGAMDGGGK